MMNMVVSLSVSINARVVARVTQINYRYVKTTNRRVETET